MGTARRASLEHSKTQGSDSTAATASEALGHAGTRALQIVSGAGHSLLPASRRGLRQKSRKLVQVAVTCVAAFCMVEIACTSTLLRSIDRSGNARVLRSPLADQQLFTAAVQDPKATSVATAHVQASSTSEESSLSLQVAVNKAAETTVEPTSTSGEHSSPIEITTPAPPKASSPVSQASKSQINAASSPKKETLEPQYLPAKETNETTSADDRLRTRSDKFDTSVSRNKGVIICLHDGVLSMGLSLIRDLRCLGNTELVQVYHCFPDELSSESRDELTISDPRVEIIDVCTYYTEKGALEESVATKFRNWWVKPLALVHTNLQEVVLLDADVIPMQDPAIVRKLPGYVQTGTTFFYDRVMSSKSFFNTFMHGKHYLQYWLETFDYATFGVSGGDGAAPSMHMLTSFAFAGKTCHEQDSSMVLVDKRRAGKALDVLWFLITKKRFEFEFSFGDKESFWLAFEFARREYFFSPWGTSVVSSTPNEDMANHPDTLCGSIAHFVPVEDDKEGNQTDSSNKHTPELLYVNGKALLKPLSLSAMELKRGTLNNWYNANPSHVTPRQHRRENGVSSAKQYRRFPQECLVGLGSTPLSTHFQRRLLQRRLVIMAIEAKLPAAAIDCSRF